MRGPGWFLAACGCVDNRSDGASSTRVEVVSVANGRADRANASDDVSATGERSAQVPLLDKVAAVIDTREQSLDVAAEGGGARAAG